jgi:hypothetical protein
MLCLLHSHSSIQGVISTTRIELESKSIEAVNTMEAIAFILRLQDVKKNLTVNFSRFTFAFQSSFFVFVSVDEQTFDSFFFSSFEY